MRPRDPRHTPPVADEIERKFLVAELPEQLGPGEQLRQGYLAEDGAVTLRVRLTAERALLTVKAGSGLVRTEVEVPIDAAEAEQLWPHTEGRRIEKRRHRIELGPGGPVAELDVYAGVLDGLATVEVEFADRSAADAFDAPPWFGVEVTGVPGWSNAELARRAAPPRPPTAP